MELQSENEPEKAENDEGKTREPKKIRRRKKQMHKKLLSQMEFYFSSSNLLKDRYMTEITAKDPCKQE